MAGGGIVSKLLDQIAKNLASFLPELADKLDRANGGIGYTSEQPMTAEGLERQGHEMCLKWGLPCSCHRCMGED